MVDGSQGHDLHGHAAARPRLCHHRQGRQARGQDPAAGPDPAQRSRLQGRRALRARHQQGASATTTSRTSSTIRASRSISPTSSICRPTIHHNWKYAAFGPDGKLYIQVGANCNICEINPGVHGQIRRYNADGSGMEIVARGVRNTVGFDWHPVTKELWFTDNGRDWAGNDGPEDELNRIAKGQEGANFGFPYCHANGIADPDIKMPNPCAGVMLPAALTGPHSAGLGIKFYTGNMFPKQLPERRLHRPARLLEPRAEVRLRRGDRADSPDGNGEDRAVHDRAARRGQERVPRPADLSCCRCRTARCWCPTSRTARSTASPMQRRDRGCRDR